MIGIHEIGSFEVTSGKVEITDPCYSPESGILVKDVKKDRKSTRLNSSHSQQSRMPSSA